MKNTFPYQLITLFFVIFMVCFVLAFYAMGWTEPTQAPPGGNVDVPINIGAIGQTKAGALVVSGGFESTGSALLAIQALTKVGIGTDSPTEKLHVVGDVYAHNGDVCQRNPITGAVTCLGSTQERVSQECVEGSAIRVINEDGTVECETDLVGGSGSSLECVSGRYKDTYAFDTGDIWQSNLGNDYAFTYVFLNSGTIGGNPYLQCNQTNEWVLTGCSAATEDDPADNDEAMSNNNCIGDDKGTNLIYARCCRTIPGGGGVSSVWDSGWFAISNGGTQLLSHNFGNTAMIITIYAADDSSGTNAAVIGGVNREADSDAKHGASIQSITTTNFRFYAGYNGYRLFTTSSPYYVNKNWAWARVVAFSGI